MKIIFKPKINIAHYSEDSVNMVKMQLTNITFQLNKQEDSYTVSYIENKVNGDPITTEVPKYDNYGISVLDEAGVQINETVVRDNISFLRNVTYKVSIEDFDYLSAQIKNSLPNNLSQTEMNKAILKQGIKIFILEKGYYQGVIKSMNDFE